MKKLLLYCIMTVCSCNCLFAQFSIGKSSSQLMIEKSIVNGLYIIAQDYQLCDSITGDKYGRNNNKQFNTIYSLGIGVNGRLITNDRVINPSKYDNQYEKYKSRYIPTNSDLVIRHWNDSTIKIQGVKDDLPKGMCFSDCESTNYSETGWLVVASSSNSANKKAEFTAYVKNIRCDEDTLIDVSEWGVDNVLGGFYMIPSYEKPGEIKFQIVSFLKEKKDNKWIMSPLKNYSVEEKSRDCDTNISDNSASDDVLTPISSGKDKKKSTKTKKKE